MANENSLNTWVSEDRYLVHQIAHSVVSILAEQYNGATLDIHSSPFPGLETGVMDILGDNSGSLGIGFSTENVSARLIIKESEIEEGIVFDERTKNQFFGLIPVSKHDFPFGARGLWFIAQSDHDVYRKFEIWIVDFSCQPIWKEFIHRECFLNQLFREICLLGAA